MSSIAQRIKEYADFKRISIRQIELQSNITAGVLAKSLQRSGDVSGDSLFKIVSAFPDVSLEWLVGGTEPMIKTENSIPEKGIVESIKDELAEVKKRLDELEKK